MDTIDFKSPTTPVYFNVSAAIADDPAEIRNMMGRQIDPGHPFHDPDTPKELADAARSFGDTLQLIGMNALSGLPNSDPAQADRIKQAEVSRNKLGELCAK